MIKQLLSKLALFIILIATTFQSVNAEDINKISTKELENLFKTYGYNRYIYMPEWKYPPIFLEHIPYDFNKIENTNKRINLFIKIMIPLAILTNEEILMERLDFLEIRLHFKKEKDLTDKQKQQLENFAKKYDVFTRLKGWTRYNLLIEQLDKKINIIPPSILIAAAAIETNWGASESLQKTNSLYRELVWYSDEGLKIEDENDDSYRLKIFPTLHDSMKSYALKINSNVNYEIFRHSRSDVLDRGKILNGRDMAHHMFYSSNIKNFIGLLDYTITFYELTNIDGATLGFSDQEDL